MNILGIGGLLGHDSNASLVVNGEVIFAAQEERFSRIKHDASFPIQAIKECLAYAHIDFEDIDVVVLAEKPVEDYFFKNFKFPFPKVLGFTRKYFEKKAIKNTPFLKSIKTLFPNAQIKYSWHHFSHVIAAYYSSEYSEAAFICVDGKGEFANASIGFIDKNNATITHELPYGNGLGLLYTMISHFLGFPSVGSEYKVMGLAPYGKPRFVEKIKELFYDHGDGAIILKKEIGFHPTDIANSMPWMEKVLGISHRNPQELLQDEHVDLASSIQSVFEEIILKMAAFVKSNFQSNNLLFCGGCAQNCVAAGKLLETKIFDNVFNSPVGGDMGSSLGAILAYTYASKFEHATKFDFKGYYLGSKPGEITNPTAKYFQVSLGENIYEFMAQELSKGKIIAWVQAGMELGARSLGARSILANPLIPNIQTDLNLKIKFRESFRPFAPAILIEEASNWFEINQPSNYMQFTAYLKPELRFPSLENYGSFKENLNFPRCAIPSVVHVDYSARLQTVSKEIHPEFHQLLERFKAHTGIPILINTSFNVNGQPIVRTADEAWECFINTDVDLLVIDDKVYRNPFDKTKDQKLKWLSQFKKFSN